MSRTINRPRSFAAVLAAALLAVAAPAAHADSVVYVDGGNVWSATPNATKKVQLTTGGGWSTPTQSDDGTVAAVKGRTIFLLSADGRRIRTIAPQPARSSDGGRFDVAPSGLSLSPDGSRLAYSYVHDPCPQPRTCSGVEQTTMYTHTNVTSADPLATFGQQFGVADAEWLSDDRTVVFGFYGQYVDIDAVGGGNDSFAKWITGSETSITDGDISRDGRHGVFLLSFGANTRLGFYTLPGDTLTGLPPTAQPTLECSSTTPDARFSDPSLSPDGLGVAVTTSDGLEIARFSSIGDGCVIASDTVLSASGSQGDWGPADPPATGHPDSGSVVPAPPVKGKPAKSKPAKTKPSKRCPAHTTTGRKRCPKRGAR